MDKLVIGAIALVVAIVSIYLLRRQEAKERDWKFNRWRTFNSGKNCIGCPYCPNKPLIAVQEETSLPRGARKPLPRELRPASSRVPMPPVKPPAPENIRYRDYSEKDVKKL